MNPIFIVCNNRTNSFSGTYTHMYEIGLYFQDLGFDVRFITRPCESDVGIDFTKRYWKHLKTHTFVNYPRDITKYNVIFYNFYDHYNFYDMLKNANKLFYLITDGSDDCFKSIKYNSFKIIDLRHIFKKIQFLYDPDLPNPIKNFEIFRKNEKIKCSWGIYSKYFKRYDNVSTEDYFIYARYNDDRVPGISTYTEKSKLDLAIAYCNSNNYTWVLDSKLYLDPWNRYKGLIYTRNIDYSPRLPFEFGAVNKPTICFDISPGLKTLANNVELYKSIIMKTNKTLNIDPQIFGR